MSNNITVSGMINLVKEITSKIHGDGLLCDPSCTCFAVLKPPYSDYNDFAEIYGFDIFEPDIKVIKFKAKFINKENYQLPSLLDFMIMPEQNEKLDLLNYEVCIDFKNAEGKHTLYHLGSKVIASYMRIKNNHYLVIKLHENTHVNDNNEYMKLVSS